MLRRVLPSAFRRPFAAAATVPATQRRHATALPDEDGPAPSPFSVGDKGVDFFDRLSPMYALGGTKDILQGAAQAYTFVGALLANADPFIKSPHRRNWKEAFERLNLTKAGTETAKKFGDPLGDIAGEPKLTHFLTREFSRMLRYPPAMRHVNLFAIAHPDDHVAQARVASVVIEQRRDAAAAPEADDDDDAVLAAGAPAAAPGTASKAAAADTGAVATTAAATAADAAAGVVTAGQELREAMRARRLVVSVDLLVVGPPERWCDNYRFFYDRVEPAGGDESDDKAAPGARGVVQSELSAKLGIPARDVVELARRNAARLFAINGAFPVFRVFDWLSRTAVNEKLVLVEEAIPLSLLGLPPDFMQRPPLMKKTIRLVLGHDGAWRVDMVAVDGHYVKDFWGEHATAAAAAAAAADDAAAKTESETAAKRSGDGAEDDERGRGPGRK